MRRYLFLTFIFFTLSASAQVKDPLKLWYTAPARVWEEALALGNGKTGAMVFGRVNKERIQLNNATLWSGYPNAGNNPKGQEFLPKVRQAVTDGDYGQAATYWKNMQGTYSARYLTMADLFLDFGLKDSTTTNYNRTLDLNTAVHTVTYQINGVNYKRETLVSYPDRVLAIRITADQKNAISFTTSLTSKLRYQTNAIQPNYLVLKGKAPKHVAHRATEPQQIVYDDKEGMTFEVHVKIKNEGGNVTASNNEIKVSKANAVTIYLTNGTSFNGFDKSPGLAGVNPSIEAKANLKNAELKSFATIKAAHLADYQKLFNRVNFSLNANADLIKLPTNVRLSKQGQAGNDQGLQTLYYQFGRYLMIASSRQGSQATNLQGIWNDAVQPPWGSNYTVNANTQMNYWLAENTNLSELHQPLFDFIGRLAKNGAITAKVNYGITNGWVVHHNSDIWAKTSPSGGYDWDPKAAARWSAWPMGGAWLSTHLYEHYLFTGDKVFLKEKGYPLMKGAAQFMLNWLVKDKNGYLVTNPSTSPENVFNLNGKDFEISMATTMDMSIIKELFTDCIASAKALNIDKEFTEKLIEAKAKLYPFHIGQYGQLQEWFNDVDNPKDTHRHLSHLFGLYPGQQINPLKTPELAAAAKQSLLHRGDVSTGWSMAWKINWWARLFDGDHALKILKTGLTLIDPVKSTEVAMTGGGTYPNLFDAHPPFQIDGNFGATAGITEMLLQSQNGELYLLPALPKEWTIGAISGIKARGNFTLNISWKNNKLTKAVIVSNIGGNCRLRTNIPVKVVETTAHTAKDVNSNQLNSVAKVEEFKKNGDAKLLDLSIAKSYVIDFSTVKGKSYTIVPL
ncbi:glycoside hydrolase family 95 protein [Pedobacter sp. LMG 31464]|uniref:Glycoside hydrolase family 95 protein n=1 Tax=Pedobacter planticolens TaxID=2679964 RepID=A0A923DW88_9SPHI|nr:glycoside hydrolase family 95 protein [Pedobacter planticolens]MBB2145131.1 glycoside hydrolase family 95 protein [Pedobacter planticolens]